MLKNNRDMALINDHIIILTTVYIDYALSSYKFNTSRILQQTYRRQHCWSRILVNHDVYRFDALIDSLHPGLYSNPN